MMPVLSLELFKDLSECQLDLKCYDFHNDFVCNEIHLNNHELSFDLRNIKTDSNLVLKFSKVSVVALDFLITPNIAGLTIDSFYRGRTEIDGNLIEDIDNELGFFYIEFYEGHKMEFWAKGLELKYEIVE